MEHFRLISRGLDVNTLIKAIERQPDLWRENTIRQDTKGSPHLDTECIFLRWATDMTLRGVFECTETADYGPYAKLPEARALLDVVLPRVDGGEVGRLMLAKLKPGGMITPHSDEGRYADHFERFHVSLESEPGNAFMVGDEKTGCGEFVHMQPGELWWFNHKMTHWVANSSDKPRTHFIIDVVALKHRRERPNRLAERFQHLE